MWGAEAALGRSGAVFLVSAAAGQALCYLFGSLWYAFGYAGGRRVCPPCWGPACSPFCCLTLQSWPWPLPFAGGWPRFLGPGFLIRPPPFLRRAYPTPLSHIDRRDSLGKAGDICPMKATGARPEAAHLIILEERERLSVSGVEEVESFDENTIVMSTTRGTLVIRGDDLHIEKLRPGTAAT